MWSMNPYLEYSTGVSVRATDVQRAGYTSLLTLCSYVETLYLLQMVTPLLLCRQQGEELQEITFGMGNRRRSVYASLEV